MMRSVRAIAVCMVILGMTACSDDDESPTSPRSAGIGGEYRLAIQAASSCGTELDVGREVQFNATITQSGDDLTIALVSEQGFPTEGQFEGTLDGSVMSVEGTVHMAPSEGTRDYEASGEILGPVGADIIRGLFEGTIRYGEATCSAREHRANFVRE